MSEEIWKSIPGYEGIYEVSNLGRVKTKNYKRTGEEKILSPGKGSNGYLTVALTKNGRSHTFSVHRLVARMFCPSRDGASIVNHINGNKEDNKADNLEWCSAKENICHAMNILGHREAWKRVKCVDTGTVYDSIAQASRDTGVNKSNIGEVIKGNRATAGGLFWMGIGVVPKRTCVPRDKGPVLCVETGKIFKNVTDATTRTGIKNIDKASSGKRKTAGGLHWRRIRTNFSKKNA